MELYGFMEREKKIPSYFFIITKETATPSFSFHNAEVSGLKEGANVGIYDLNGRLISAVRADAVGHATLNLSSLPKGIYILRTPTRSFKFVNQ